MKRDWDTGYLGTVLGNGPSGRTLTLLIAGFAMAMLSFAFVIRPAHHARRQPRDISAHPGTRGAGGRGQVAGRS
jgi:hypothetical protein